MRAWLAPGLCLVAGWAGAQPPSLAQADDAWNRLRQQGEAAALAPLLAEDRLLTHSDGRMQHKADDLQALATRPRRTPRIDNEDVRIRRYGDTAVVTGTSVQAAVSDGPPWEGRLRVTRVWVLHDGRGQRVASHSSHLAPTGPRKSAPGPVRTARPAARPSSAASAPRNGCSPAMATARAKH